MASIINDFPEFLNAATIQRGTVTNVDGDKTTELEAVATIECLFWEGGSAEAFASQRFRDVTSAVLGVYPGTDIQKNDIITVEGVKYHVLGVDNVGLADEVTIVALRVFK